MSYVLQWQVHETGIFNFDENENVAINKGFTNLYVTVWFTKGIIKKL